MKKTIIAVMLTLAICLGTMIPAFGLSSESQKANIELDLDDKESGVLGTVPVDLIQSYCHFNLSSATLQSEALEKLNSQFLELVGSGDIDFARLYTSTKKSISEATRNAARNIDRSVHIPSVNSVRNINSTAIVSNESELIAALLDTTVTVIIVIANIQLTDARAMNRSLVIMAMNGSYTFTSASGKAHFLIQNQSAPISITFSNIILDGNNLGGGIVIENSDVTLNNAIIQNCAENGVCSGNAIDASNIALDPVSNELQSTGDLTINFGSLTGNECGGVSCTGPISIYGATISENSGSGVSAINLCEEGATAYFESVSISENESEIRGGGLFLWGYTVIITGTVSNGQVVTESDISGNAAQYGGGGVYAYLCSTDISYTDIEENTIEFVEPSVSTIDPIDIGGAGIMNVGDLSIEHSTVQDNIGDCDFGFGVGIYALNPAAVLNNYDPDDYPWLSEAFTVTDSTISGNECTWATGADPYDRSMNGGGIAVIELKPKLTRTEISDNEALIGGGALVFYAYDEDPQDDPVIHFSGITVEDNVGKLAGGGIAMIGPDREDDDDDVVPASIKCKLQLEKNVENNNENPVETLTTISGNTSRYGAGITVFSVEVTVKDGTVVQNNYADSSFTPFVGNDWPNWACAGGGVLLAEQSKLDLSNGEILSNTTLKTSAQQSAGAGIYAMGASEVFVHGASAVSTNGFHVEDVDDLTNRTSTSVDTMFGGGIYTEAATTTSVSGGSVHGNASSYGAGIYCCGDLDVSGGGISENTCVQSGGGIYVQSTGSLDISGGDIYANIATNGAGAGIYTTAPMDFTGGIIQSNKANSTTGGLGGGVYATNEVKMTGQYENGICVDGIISDNEALYGGGVFYDGDEETWKMYSGSINNNTATQNGGGVYIGSDATWMMYNGDVSSNKSSAGNGSGFYVESELIIAGGTISQNRARGSGSHGGGIFIDASGTVSNTGCAITRNRSDSTGGGVYVKRGASYTENYNSYVTLNTPDNIFWE